MVRNMGTVSLTPQWGKHASSWLHWGRALIGLAWATCILGIWGMVSDKWPSWRCCPNSVAGRAGLVPRRRAWGSVLGTQSYGYHPCSPDQLQCAFHSVKCLLNTSALRQTPSPSFTWAHSLVKETNTQQIITMQGTECDNRDRLRMLSEHRQESLNSACSI